jgi:membrane protein
MDEMPKIILEPTGTEVQTAAGGARRYRKSLKSFRWDEIRWILGESFGEWNKHKAPRLGAALAFYTLLSITPLMLVVVPVMGLVLGNTIAESDLIQQMQDLVGSAGGKAIQGLLDGAKSTTHGIIATVIGLLTLLFGASGVLIELRDALNTIWDVRTPELKGNLQRIRSYTKERAFSFALVLAIGFLLLVSLAVNAAISAVGAFSASVFPAGEVILHILNSMVSFVITTGLFAAIYKDMPRSLLSTPLRAAIARLLATAIYPSPGRLHDRLDQQIILAT